MGWVQDRTSMEGLVLEALESPGGSGPGGGASTGNGHGHELKKSPSRIETKKKGVCFLYFILVEFKQIPGPGHHSYETKSRRGGMHGTKCYSSPGSGPEEKGSHP